MSKSQIAHGDDAVTRNGMMASSSMAAMDAADAGQGRARTECQGRRETMRQEGLARHARHNDALKLQGAIRRWGGLQIEMFAS